MTNIDAIQSTRNIVFEPWVMNSMMRKKVGMMSRLFSAELVLLTFLRCIFSRPATRSLYNFSYWVSVFIIHNS